MTTVILKNQDEKKHTAALKLTGMSTAAKHAAKFVKGIPPQARNVHTL